MQTYPHVQPSIRFLSVRPEVCPWVSRFPTSGFLQIPSHDGHPCLRLYPSHYRADLGLAPLRNVRRQAHIIKGARRSGKFLPAGFFFGFGFWAFPSAKRLLLHPGSVFVYPVAVGRHFILVHGSVRTGSASVVGPAAGGLVVIPGRRGSHGIEIIPLAVDQLPSGGVV